MFAFSLCTSCESKAVARGQEIIRLAEETFSVSLAERNHSHGAVVRVVLFFLRRDTPLSLPQQAELLGYAHSSTLIWHRKMLDQRRGLHQAMIDQLSNRLAPPKGKRRAAQTA